MATDPLKLENLKHTILAIQLKAKQPPVGTLAKSKDQKSPPREKWIGWRLEVKQDPGLVGDYWLP